METWYEVTFAGEVRPITVVRSTPKTIVTLEPALWGSTKMEERRRHLTTSERWGSGYFRSELMAYEAVFHAASRRLEGAQERLVEDRKEFDKAKRNLEAVRRRAALTPKSAE